MRSGYQIHKQDALYYFTMTVVDWVDVFTRKICCDTIVDSLQYCRKHKGLKVWAYVKMSNHLHSILSATNDNLSAIVRDFKRHTGSTILKQIQCPEESRRDWMLKRFEFAARSNVRNSDHQFWMHQSHPMELDSKKFIDQKLNYIHLNPVQGGMVDKVEDWVYSSARNYMYLPAVMEVDLLDVNF